MRFEVEDLNLLADETIYEDVVVPVKRAFFLYTPISVIIFTIIFRTESWHFLLGTSLIIFLISGLLFLMIYFHEKGIVRNFETRVLDFQRIGEAVEKGGVIKVASISGFRIDDDDEEEGNVGQ